MQLRKIYLFSLLLLLGACETDFEVNAEWEEVTIVYALLDSTQDAQYIRIQKAFQTDGQSASDVAKIGDSIYHKDELEASLIELNGSQETRYKLEPTTEFEKEDGVFNVSGHVIYKTPDGFYLNEDRTYRLEIRTKATDNLVSAETAIIGRPGITTSNLIRYRENLPLRLVFSPGSNSHFYDLALRMIYDEYTDDTIFQQRRVAHWQMFDYRVVSGSQVQSVTPMDEVFTTMRNLIPDPESGIVRRVSHLEFVLMGGDREIYNYTRVNRPSIGIVQKNPEYTNVNNGRGIFASMRKDTIHLTPSNTFIDFLVDGHIMQGKNFVR